MLKQAEAENSRTTETVDDAEDAMEERTNRGVTAMEDNKATQLARGPGKNNKDSNNDEEGEFSAEDGPKRYNLRKRTPWNRFHDE